jgi:hypothetical protein
MKFKELLKENILKYIEDMARKDSSGWYVSGGCFEFALKLLNKLKGSKAWIVGDSSGDDGHAFVEHKGKFYDINGEHKSKIALIKNGQIDVYPPYKFRKASKKDLEALADR